MVEVTPSSGEINLKAGWFYFTIFCCILFPILFYFIPNAGYNWVGIGVAIFLAVVVDIFYFHAPFVFLVIIGLIVGIVLAAKHFL